MTLRSFSLALVVLCAACSQDTPSDPGSGSGVAGSTSGGSGAGGSDSPPIVGGNAGSFVGGAAGGPVVGGAGGASQGGGSGGAGQSGSGGSGGNVSKTCRTLCDPGECGPVADGCGAVLECGECTAPQVCGGGDDPQPSRCGGTVCEPKTCADFGVSCGQRGDGCGNVLECGTCTGTGEECVEGSCEVTFVCTRLTCAEVDGTGLCGPVLDGCGGTLDCGFECGATELCGANNNPGQCGTPVCEPMDCATALTDRPLGYCGIVADGCGGTVPDCGTVCTGSETCGGGGVPDQCGENVVCEPLTVSDCEAGACGALNDGCGGTVDCGGCTPPETCGGGEVPSQCGAPPCVPQTCESLNAECGDPQPDGCDGLTQPCGGCAPEQVCNANRCEAVQCQPQTAQQACAAGACGPVSDGCSGSVDCGVCSAPEVCGANDNPGFCSEPICIPLTCQDIGASCGPQGDGCGNQISCGGCQVHESCQGTPSRCVVNQGGGPGCTGLCENQVYCPPGQETSVSGVVRSPAGAGGDPLVNVLVYVPNGTLPAIAAGPGCERCEDEDLGSPLVAAISSADGSFQLNNVPTGVDFPLVVKVGKWRRAVTIPAVAPCSQNVLAPDDSRLPRSMTDAEPTLQPYVNIPRIAMVTGNVDEIECVLRKIGLEDQEFTVPGTTGRVHFYRDETRAFLTSNPNGGAVGCSSYASDGINCDVPAPSVSDNDLFGNTRLDGSTGSRLDDYDMAIFGCEGSSNRNRSGRFDALRQWVEAGGRLFASHYAYTYLENNGSFDSTAVWGGQGNGNGPVTTGIVDTTHPKGQAFNNWLAEVGAHHPTHGNGYISIQDPRSYVQSANANTELFVYTEDNHSGSAGDINAVSAVQQFAFNAPVGAAESAICGRVVYSAFHVADASTNVTEVFPEHCASPPLTAQERVLEYMLFDLAACVSTGEPPAPPECTPHTCQSVGADCGFLSDGCGGVLDCGVCTGSSICGGGGTPNVCGTGCSLETCGSQGANCGSVGDGCGGTLDCGDCTPPAVCGGGGTAGICGTPACTPLTCQERNASCGSVGDGCGGTLDCGDCTAPAVCGGAGIPNQCGEGTCTPTSCAAEQAECGSIGDGCGAALDCGTCPTGYECGVGGPNRCGQLCVPRTCAEASAGCGFIGDGCGGVLDCGDCTPPQTCGGGGVASQCGGSCTVQVSCQSAGADCGTLSDGCGGTLQCGNCPPGEVCGATGPNTCGPGSCNPGTCGAQDCGLVSDGCSGVLDCGACPDGCVPRDCAAAGANCGPVADGCGGLLDCGVCYNGDTCGGGGTPSVCGGGIQ